MNHAAVVWHVSLLHCPRSILPVFPSHRTRCFTVYLHAGSSGRRMSDIWSKNISCLSIRSEKIATNHHKHLKIAKLVNFPFYASFKFKAKSIIDFRYSDGIFLTSDKTWDWTICNWWVRAHFTFLGTHLRILRLWTILSGRPLRPF